MLYVYYKIINNLYFYTYKFTSPLCSLHYVHRIYVDFLHYFVFKYYRFPIYDEMLIFLIRIPLQVKQQALNNVSFH